MIKGFSSLFDNDLHSFDKNQEKYELAKKSSHVSTISKLLGFCAKKSDNASVPFIKLKEALSKKVVIGMCLPSR